MLSVLAELKVLVKNEIGRGRMRRAGKWSEWGLRYPGLMGSWEKCCQKAPTVTKISVSLLPVPHPFSMIQESW